MSAAQAISVPSFYQQQRNTVRRIREHAHRCESLPPLKPGEAERLVAEYAAKRGGFTQCPTVFLLAVHH